MERRTSRYHAAHPRPGNGSRAPDGQRGAFLPAVLELCHVVPGRTERRVEASPDGTWIRVQNGRVPAQGWKLHVSATLASADDVLRRTVPILLAEDATFKVAGSAQVLAELNSAGHATLSQIGKFITVYPHDDDQAVGLAISLHEATRGLRGPAIRSDRPFAPGSLVYYRYGGFDDHYVQTPLGELLPAINTPDGEVVPDQRLGVYSPPSWAVDPFLAAGVGADPRRAFRALVAGRYLVVAALSATPRGEVCLAVDIESPRRVVLKRGARDASMDAEGRDARDRLRHEREVIARLRPDPRFPKALDLFEEDGDLVLVLEDVEGESLERHVMQLATRGCCLPPMRVTNWGREIAATLGAIHAKGFIYRDVKPTNVIVAPDGRLRLVDFELAYELAATATPFGHGTLGYISPQQYNGEPPAVTDDVYGLGALLYFMITGADPSLAPSMFAPHERPLELLNRAIGPDLGRVISRCLGSRVEDRFRSMAEVEAALAAVSARARGSARAFGQEEAHETESRARPWRELARQLGDSLCRAAVPAPDGEGVAWLSTHLGGSGLRARDVNTGSAGSLLALAELVAELGEPEHEAVLAAGARWLAIAPRPAGEPLPGLYVGEGGVGAALLRAAEVLGDEQLLAAAAERGSWIAALPYASPDLFNGTAGRLRFYLLLWDETGDIAHLRNATACGDQLLETAERPRRGERRWTIPPGYAGLSGHAYLGYAHGAAGIGDALLDLFEATGDARFGHAARDAGRFLMRLAVPVLEDESGLDWPSVEGGTLFGAFWCHGAAGVGRFFLNAARLGVLPDAGATAARAARTVARGARWAGPTQCHGLAGNIEFLIDVFRATGEDACLAESYLLAQLLESFSEERNGSLVFPSELPHVFTPDFMVGYAGVAACLLRLSDPQTLPHVLSREGFRRTGSR